MAQFDVYRNMDATTKHRIPYLMDVQNDLFESLTTCLVIPLVAKSALLEGLNSTVSIRGEDYVISTQELCSVARDRLKEKVFSYDEKAEDVLKCLEFLFLGFESQKI